MFDVGTAKFTKFFRYQFLGFCLFILSLEVRIFLTNLARKLNDLSHNG
ncbi:hypothetical protein LEP1GSC185_3649 [Leptospira licerasiae serovar Varillal str. VAR 010]|nr:hypothetical protein LEP1GSC185_3649 [Leptospira licerasiae serovar Varillal str. VAR 010]